MDLRKLGMAEDALEAARFARLHQLNPENIPQHVAIIMDGNGRWARQRRMPRVFGHRRGADRVREVVEAAGQIGVNTLTLFAFSDENWSRPEAEVTAIMRLLNIYLAKEEESLDRNNVRLEVIGEVGRLPESNQQLLKRVSERLRHNTGLRLVLALSYGGRSEIVGACRRIAEGVQQGTLAVEDIDVNLFGCYLQTNGFPGLDLLIRTSGECRISNFLLWQLAYSELYFTNRMWPEFSKQDFFHAIRSYQLRDRRFGGVVDDDEATVAFESVDDINICSSKEF
jgi:undecaprenyl diphosphate synthase